MKYYECTVIQRRDSELGGIQIHLGRKSTDKGTRHGLREQHVQSQGSLMEHGTLRKLTNAQCGAAIKGQNDRLAQK